jgi:hypothetical protein
MSIQARRSVTPLLFHKVLRAVAALLMLALGTVAATGIATAQTAHTVSVSTVAALMQAVSDANSAGGNWTILVADGTYTLTRTLHVTAANVTIAGQPGHREAVTIQGDAMSATAAVGDLILVDGSNFQLHDITLQRSGWSLIQIQGEQNAQSPIIRDCILRDSYQQMLKVSQDPSKPNVVSDNGLVENCIFEYTAGIGPEYYIGGIDAHGAHNWIVRHNTFRNIISPNTMVAEFAVHFWDLPSGNNLVEQNLIINCDRGIGFGLDGRGNTGGIIRNNMIYHAANAGAFADSGISLTDSPHTQVYNNTIYRDDSFHWAIDYRYSDTVGVLIVNNLTNALIQLRDGASGTASNNVTSAGAGWFVNPPSGDLHLASAVPVVVGKGKTVSGLTDDFDGQVRPQGSIDIGADQYGAVAGTVGLSWSHPTQNTDGSALTNAAGYVIRYGSQIGALNAQISVSSANTTSAVIEKLTKGTWYFEIATVNAAGVRSEFSAAVSAVI